MGQYSDAEEAYARALARADELGREGTLVDEARAGQVRMNQLLEHATTRPLEP